MRLSAIHQARVIFFLEVLDLNPRGAAYYPSIVRALNERYGFQKFPQEFKDFDESKGITFELGTTGNTTIDKFVIYQNGLQLDTRASTEDSEAILEEALSWAAQTLGLKYTSDMVKMKAYVSYFSFYSDSALLQVNPILKNLSMKLAKTVSENLHLSAIFEPTGILWGLDPAEQRMPVQSFSIERRQQTPFSEGKYFSAAPLPTDIHLALVEEFEKAVLAQNH
jgi:hypothetical protein